MLTFTTQQQAIEFMFDSLTQDGESCIDNIRFAFVDNDDQVEEYEIARADGCCGFCDMEVMVDNRKAWVGCNYGH